MTLNKNHCSRLYQCLWILGLLISVFSLAPAWGADDEQPAQAASPSHNLLRRIVDDYEVIHGEGGLLPQRWRSAPLSSATS